MAIIKRVAKRFNSFFISMGKARAAAELHRMGYHEAAKNIMLINS